MAASLDHCATSSRRNFNFTTRRSYISHTDTKYSSYRKATSAAFKTNGNLTNNKIILVITIVIGCFALLWPIVFYPMLQAAFSSPSASEHVPYTDRTGARGSMHPAMMHPRIREEMTAQINSPREASSAHRSPLRSRDRSAPLSAPDSSHLPALAGPGLMGFIIPLYFMIVVAFLFYTMVIVLRRSDCSNGTDEPSPSSANAAADHLDDSSDTSHVTRTAQGQLYQHKVQSSDQSDEKSSNVSQCVHQAKQEISKLAAAYSKFKLDQLIEASLSPDQENSSIHANCSCCCMDRVDDQLLNQLTREKQKSTDQSCDTKRDYPFHLHAQTLAPVDTQSDNIANITADISTNSEENKSNLTTPRPSFAIDDVDEIIRLRKKLQQKERIIEKLLETINGLGSRLVDAGVLPSLPGLFSDRKEREKQLIEGHHSDNDGEDAAFSAASADHSIDNTQHVNLSNSERVEKQLAASTSFIASLGAANGKRVSSSHRSILVSRGLRLLVQNMKLFELFLIEVEDLRQRVNLLEARRVAVLNTTEQITFSHQCDCNKDNHERVTSDPLHDENIDERIVLADACDCDSCHANKETASESGASSDADNSLSSSGALEVETDSRVPKSSPCHSQQSDEDEYECALDEEKQIHQERIQLQEASELEDGLK